MDITQENKAKAYAIEDTVTMKKPHACGGNEWIVARLGADIKLRCNTCGKYINISRDELRRREKNK